MIVRVADEAEGRSTITDVGTGATVVTIDAVAIAVGAVAAGPPFRIVAVLLLPLLVTTPLPDATTPDDLGRFQSPKRLHAFFHLH